MVLFLILRSVDGRNNVYITLFNILNFSLGFNQREYAFFFTDAESLNDKTNAGAVAGGVVAGILACIVIGLLLLLLWNKNGLRGNSTCLCLCITKLT